MLHIRHTPSEHVLAHAQMPGNLNLKRTTEMSLCNVSDEVLGGVGPKTCLTHNKNM